MTAEDVTAVLRVKTIVVAVLYIAAIAAARVLEYERLNKVIVGQFIISVSVSGWVRSVGWDAQRLDASP